MNEKAIAEQFFDTYTRALLDRDARSVADHYAVPGLIAAPDQSVAVLSRSQTEEFFTSAFAQYEGVSTALPAIDVVAGTGHSLWADVTWSFDGVPAERSMYQLVRAGGDWKIAVLTPLNS